MIPWKLLFMIMLLTLSLPTPLRAAGETAPPVKVLKISGCSISRVGYLDFLTAAFTQRTGIRVLLKGGGSAAGLLNLHAAATDLAASCLPPEAEDVPPATRFVPVAKDALVFIVHPDNPLTSISLEQARAIFLGQIANWQSLGGPDLGLRFYLQQASGTSRRNLRQGGPLYFVEKKLLQGRRITADPTIVSPRPSGGLVEEALALDPSGFAITGFTSARMKTTSLKMLAVDGVLPSRDTIISGAYAAALRRPLYLVLPAAATPAAERFLAFVLSGEGQALLSSHGMVALEDIP
jgi:phosphate transport system substrate-binding protein